MSTEMMVHSTNPRICSFYKEHPSIDFETVNLFIIDVIEKLALSRKAENSRCNSPTLEDTINALNTNIADKISDLQKENAVRQQITHAKFINEIGDMFKKNGPAARKTEEMNINNLTITLNSIYNTAEFIHQESIDQSSTFLMKRYMKSAVLFNFIDTDQNVTSDDITFFAKTIETKNCHGVFVSQRSGFSSKPNYHIEYHRGNIIVFIHNAEYSADKIKIAIDIIDNISLKLKELNLTNSDDNSISKAVLDDINKEYQLFISQKEALISIYKDCQKKVLSQIDEIRFPCLDKYLSTKYTNSVQKQGFKCDLCKCFNANNLKALAAHKRGCIRKNNFVTIQVVGQ